jgi:hypothetical protein
MNPNRFIFMTMVISRPKGPQALKSSRQSVAAWLYLATCGGHLAMGGDPRNWLRVAKTTNSFAGFRRELLDALNRSLK